MSAEVQKPAHKIEAPLAQRIRSVRLIESAPFAGTESTTIQMEPGKCDRVYAARMESDGTAVAIEKGQRSDGLVFEREWIDRNTNQKRLERIFQYSSNVRCVVY